MGRYKRMILIRDLAQREETTEAMALRDANEAVDSALSQLQALESYRSQYTDQLGKMQTGRTADAILSLQRFVASLNDAIDVSNAEVAASRERQDAQQLRWIESYQRANALEQHCERLLLQEQRSLEKIEQSMLDDRIGYQLPGR